MSLGAESRVLVICSFIRYRLSFICFIILFALQFTWTSVCKIINISATHDYIFKKTLACFLTWSCRCIKQYWWFFRQNQFGFEIFLSVRNRSMVISIFQNEMKLLVYLLHLFNHDKTDTLENECHCILRGYEINTNRYVHMQWIINFVAVYRTQFFRNFGRFSLHPTKCDIVYQPQNNVRNSL